MKHRVLQQRLHAPRICPIDHYQQLQLGRNAWRQALLHFTTFVLVFQASTAVERVVPLHCNLWS
jgi:hypothetical protein